MKNMLYLGLCLLTFTIDVSAAPTAETAKPRGQLLYENHCTQCHTSVAYARNPRRVNDLNTLSQWVKKWAEVGHLDWSPEDVREVSDYLNHEFYHFTN